MVGRRLKEGDFIVKRKITFGQAVLMLLMLFITLTMIIPLLNILARSLSDPSVSMFMTGLDIFPKKLNFINYRIILNHPIILPALKNSIFITVVGVAINMLLTTTAAYVLTRPGLVFKKYIMGFLIVMMLFDPGLVPEYLVVRDLKLIGSQWSVILITAVNVYYLIIMMRYFDGVPEEMYEAAKIDGAGHLRTLWSVVLPLAKAGIATIVMFYAVLRWNEYFKAGIYISSMDKTTLPVVMRQFIVLNDTVSIIGAENILNYNEMARVDLTALKNATIVVAIIPILIFYPFVLKFYTKDVLAGGVKE